MEIKEDYDVNTGGRKLQAGKGRKAIKAVLSYNPKLDRYCLKGDVNKQFFFSKQARKYFERYAMDPDNVDAGRPLTVGEACLPLPPGVDPEKLWEAPRCTGRKGRLRALAWNKNLWKAYYRSLKSS